MPSPTQNPLLGNHCFNQVINKYVSATISVRFMVERRHNSDRFYCVSWCFAYVTNISCVFYVSVHVDCWYSVRCWRVFCVCIPSFDKNHVSTYQRSIKTHQLFKWCSYNFYIVYVGIYNVGASFRDRVLFSFDVYVSEIRLKNQTRNGLHAIGILCLY